MKSLNLKETIDNYYSSLKINNDFFKKTADGTFTAKNLQPYLQSVLYLINNTPIHLNLAIDVSRKNNLKKIEQFFLDKFKEEIGHNKWAEQDISNLNSKHQIPNNCNVSKHIVGLVNYLSETILNNPAHYIAYIFLAEYLTVLIAPQWISDLENKCGLSRNMISVIGNHAELDKDHVLHDLDILDFLYEEGHEKDLFNTINNAMKYLDAFYTECAHAEKYN